MSVYVLTGARSKMWLALLADDAKDLGSGDPKK